MCVYLRLLSSIFFFYFLFYQPAAFAVDDTERVAVFYPKSKEPYQAIYREIIAGVQTQIKDKPNAQLEEFILEKDFDHEVIISTLRQMNIRKVVVLGRQGYKLAKLLPKEFAVVSGALPITPNGVSGISLISDPAFLFNYLDKVAPKVKTIHLAYSERSQWLIQKAKAAANSQGLTLNLKKVENTKQAVAFYHQLFESNISHTDAIWLPLDRISSHDKITLPLILEKAWTREVVVFSSKPSHAKRGALFSTYPDNFDLGQRLVELVDRLALDPESKLFLPLASLQLAVNLRTASHLGIQYSSEQQQQFKLTFPK